MCANRRLSSTSFALSSRPERSNITLPNSPASTDPFHANCALVVVLAPEDLRVEGYRFPERHNIAFLVASVSRLLFSRVHRPRIIPPARMCAMDLGPQDARVKGLRRRSRPHGLNDLITSCRIRQRQPTPPAQPRWVRTPGPAMFARRRIWTRFAPSFPERYNKTLLLLASADSSRCTMHNWTTVFVDLQQQRSSARLKQLACFRFRPWTDPIDLFSDLTTGRPDSSTHSRNSSWGGMKGRRDDSPKQGRLGHSPRSNAT
ncbi:hypothetical protein CYLTODRAFT_289321 [Cylindrobasidium torrendii FP15055 ss-10]|uniref:Uncharacterized protein n=1 Tax=Cylindrobasidium torrendii FP15055 ss-10 TaxID=1314674 RepID=A0A0D7BDG0_9AGAR|nr:hypothetical protein CYLTODRAFT_289155 [Cylindrobasidium torrendii FP15055 ss-10]KIY67614.1 hypothetical protein CYLTODRAFT_289321 [Cylindrobasidium torrendii FP15055 ss-10]